MNIVQSVAGVVMLVSTTALQAEELVEYPVGYQDWRHIKSMVIEKGHPLENPFMGIHHVYANKEANKGFENGRHRFPDGSVIVFDLMEASYADHAISEGGRKLIGVMIKNSKRYAKTGGWGFEAFAGDSRTRLVEDGGAACFACHAAQKPSDFVFSEKRS